MQTFSVKRSAHFAGAVPAAHILPQSDCDLVKDVIIIMVEMSQRSALLVELKLLFLKLQVLWTENRKKREEKVK